jgi:D-beta-D-heptose 7-phosphate kinase/D-beta-D-heptose 1-phosphate adenosyltransferase
MLRVDRESVEPVSSAEQDELFADVVSLLPDVHAVLISDYLKGALTPELLQRIITVCRERQLPVIVDPKGNDFSRYRGATALTPNRREAEIATGISITDEDTLLTAGDRLLRQLQLDAVILTRSEEGISLFTAQGSIAHFPTEAREVFDVSGAGDTVVATIGAALAVALSLADAVKLSNLAAGIVVGKLGTSTVTPAEIFNLVLRRSRLTESKILSARPLQAALAPLRSAGKQIVFTNGCFDLLHAGHVKYLQQARQLGDLLVLGLNSDASIRRLKGEKRPLLEETERAQILAALDCIDYLIIFDEDTPLDLLQLVRPDILVKGGDYSVDQVVGKDLVESYGGRVELIQFVEGKSTTNIVEKIIQRYGDDGSQRGE